MASRHPATFGQEDWEALYNHKQICEALHREGEGVAVMLLRQQAERLMHLRGSAPDVEMSYIFLTSLNRSLYSYFLFQTGASFAECCYQHRAPTYHIAGDDALLQAAETIIRAYARAYQESHAGRTHIEKACAYIQAHLHEPLTLAQVSAQVFLSRNHLCYLFKSLMGCTFCEYVTQQRLLHARMLLTTSKLSMDSIAEQCGFQDSAYFSTVFKREIGMPPTAFRKQLTNQQETFSNI